MFNDRKRKGSKMCQQTQVAYLMFVLDPKLELNQRPLCSDCINNFTTQFSTMSYELMTKQIKQNQKSKVQAIEQTIQFNIKQVEELLRNINKLKSTIAFQLDEIIRFSGGWIKNLLSAGHEYSQQGVHKELENLISKQLENSIDKSLLVDEINKVNCFWNVKINEKLEQFSSFKVYLKCQEILENLSQTIQVKQEEAQQLKVPQQNNQQSQVDQFHESKSTANQLLSEPQIKPQLIDDTIKQKSKCYAIALNKTGTQMVSMSHFDIKVWNIIDGKLNYQSTLQGHSNYIYCLLYIQMIKQLCVGNKSNKMNGRHREHKGWIGTMILNNQENQLFSAEEDQKIIVWKADFNQNELTRLYQLEKHTKSVRAISLNDCENILVSSGDDQQIIVWEFGQGDKFYLKISVYLSFELFRLSHQIYQKWEINGKLVIQNELECNAKWIFGTTPDMENIQSFPMNVKEDIQHVKYNINEPQQYIINALHFKYSDFAYNNIFVILKSKNNNGQTLQPTS